MKLGLRPVLHLNVRIEFQENKRLEQNIGHLIKYILWEKTLSTEHNWQVWRAKCSNKACMIEKSQ